MADYAATMALYAAYQAGELEAEGLEAKARILCGLDDGKATPLRSLRRSVRKMLSWGSADLGYDPHDAPLNDVALSRWYLGALSAYVQDKFG